MTSTGAIEETNNDSPFELQPQAPAPISAPEFANNAATDVTGLEIRESLQILQHGTVETQHVATASQTFIRRDITPMSSPRGTSITAPSKENPITESLVVESEHPLNQPSSLITENEVSESQNNIKDTDEVEQLLQEVSNDFNRHATTSSIKKISSQDNLNSDTNQLITKPDVNQISEEITVPEEKEQENHITATELSSPHIDQPSPERPEPGSLKHSYEISSEDDEPLAVKRVKPGAVSTISVALDDLPALNKAKPSIYFESARDSISPSPEVAVQAESIDHAVRQEDLPTLDEEDSRPARTRKIQHPSSRQQPQVFSNKSRSSLRRANQPASSASQIDSDVSSDEDDVFSITVYKVPKSAGGTSHINAIDIVSQAVDDTFKKFKSSDSHAETPTRPVLRRALSQFHESVINRLSSLVDLLDSNHILATQLRGAKLKRDGLRNRLLDLRQERSQVQRQIEQVRQSHLAQTTRLNHVREMDFLLADLDNLKEIAKGQQATRTSSSIIDEDTETPDELLNRVLLDLDLLQPILGTQGALQALEHTADKLEYLDQHLAFS